MRSIEEGRKEMDAICPRALPQPPLPPAHLRRCLPPPAAAGPHTPPPPVPRPRRGPREQTQPPRVPAEETMSPCSAPLRTPPRRAARPLYGGWTDRPDCFCF
ncbi:uncharacterized protein LOC131556384 [Ammospiza caudacuta]|uniref:uncharacterized protein LOC131556384 n=1 Tax=Ammospiza caudacuta TaxID=2857398 RepID=UPI002739FD35|nr:uncharacterized protein LOC131556384 [Ammospiza caudacuta]